MRMLEQIGFARFGFDIVKKKFKIEVPMPLDLNESGGLYFQNQQPQKTADQDGWLCWAIRTA